MNDHLQRIPGRAPRRVLGVWMVIVGLLAGTAIAGRLAGEPSKGPARPSVARAAASAQPSTSKPPAPDTPAPPASAAPRRSAARSLSAEPLPSADLPPFAAGTTVLAPLAGQLVRTGGLIEVRARRERGYTAPVSVRLISDGRVLDRAESSSKGRSFRAMLVVDPPERAAAVHVQIADRATGRVLARQPFFVVRGPIVLTTPTEPYAPLDDAFVLVAGRLFEGSGDVTVRLETRQGEVLAAAPARTFTDHTHPPASVFFDSRLRLPQLLPPGVLWLVAERDSATGRLEARMPVAAPG